MRILVTGGTGHLGTSIVSLLRAQHHDVRILARRPGEPAEGVEWVRGDLATCVGIPEAVNGVDVIVHAATDSPSARRGALRAGDLLRTPRAVDVNGTRWLLEFARKLKVSHFIYISVVGLEHAKILPYARVKLEAEALVRRSSTPYSILRATTFYWLLERMLDRMVKPRRAYVPRGVELQPADSDDFARWVVQCLHEGPKGKFVGFAGPEQLSAHDCVEQFAAARGHHPAIRAVPLPRTLRKAMTAFFTDPAAEQGATRWSDWLANLYAPARPVLHRSPTPA